MMTDQGTRHCRPLALKKMTNRKQTKKQIKQHEHTKKTDRKKRKNERKIQKMMEQINYPWLDYIIIVNLPMHCTEPNLSWN